MIAGKGDFSVTCVREISVRMRRGFSVAAGQGGAHQLGPGSDYNQGAGANGGHGELQSSALQTPTARAKTGIPHTTGMHG
ncbi:hypothetical protein M404DRAFT_1001726 [Pisolithus tinctorius Marx 270]|uniref:Uncharacterized protein n=1 Tax=Pisolithus tinctorius Marx 270 TaxID=870435 RepID=A0A0C3NQG3_PISTI|nr:hypothetical protein M404DRAFT_1001726 [Pisolithus tinctorius Marx 270]